MIARLPMPAKPQGQHVVRNSLTATWDGIEIAWHRMPSGEGCPAGPEQAATLLAHLAVLSGGLSDGEDDLR